MKQASYINLPTFLVCQLSTKKRRSAKSKESTNAFSLQRHALCLTLHLLTVCTCHVAYAFQSESTLYLPECQGTPCSKQKKKQQKQTKKQKKTL